MRRVWLDTAVVAILALLLAALASAASPAAPRFPRLPLDGPRADRPAPTAAGRPVPMMVQLREPPVAVHQARARARGRRLTPAQRAAVRARLRHLQRALMPRLRALGARPVAGYQDAYDGIKVSVAPARVPLIAALPQVLAVRPLGLVRLETDRSVPFIGAPAAWADLGVTGAGIRIGIVDGGVDYYHADLGGSGNPADFAADDGLTIGTPAFPNAKVTGGYDLVGDAYDPSAPAGWPAVTPHPDPDPLDCAANGHGTHVAGIAAGNGVLADGTPYDGPYDVASLAGRSFAVGPGVAPRATIVAYRAFGCSGQSDAIVDGIDRAVRDGVDVLNLSVGSSFGRAGDPAAVAADNAAAAGIVVVAAAGNSGAASYLVSTPSTAAGAISVASVDSVATLPGATVAGASLPPVQALDANESGLPAPVTGTLRVLRAGPDAIAMGCEDADYAGVQPGDVVVTMRGGCPRNVRPAKGQAAGVAAVIMVNTTSDLPPLEGPIPGVGIPFVGVGSDAAPALLAADGSEVTLAAAGPIPNPGFRVVAPESSAGPRSGDGAVKPDVAAPGVAIRSAGAGLGTAGVRMSGTSMAAPHVSGLAALVLEAHPGWARADRPGLVKAAVMNTADPALAAGDPDPRLMGAGIVQARRAADTVASATTGPLEASLSFGFAELAGAYSAARTITIANAGAVPIDYALVPSFTGSRLGATVTVSPNAVTVPPGGRAEVRVTLALSGPAVASLPDAAGQAAAVPAVAGAVTAIPTSAGPGVYPLRVPFLLVPRGLSDLTVASRADAARGGRATTTLGLENDGIHAGGVDVFAWELADPADTPAAADLRAVGAASLPGTALGAPAADRAIVFAVSLDGRVSNPAELTIEIPIDANGDGRPDFTVVGADSGAVLNGSPNGRLGAFTFGADGKLLDARAADAPFDGSVLLLPTLASTLGLRPPDAGGGGGTVRYGASVVSLGGLAPVVDSVAGQASFDPFAPGVDQGQHLDLAPGGRATLELGVDAALPAPSRPLGWLLVSPNDAAGPGQAEEVPLQEPAR